MFSLDKISGYEPTATGTDYCSICKYYRPNLSWCRMILRKVAPHGWCRFFRNK